jgi:hypothetical protein
LLQRTLGEAGVCLLGPDRVDEVGYVLQMVYRIAALVLLGRTWTRTTGG